MQLTFTTRVTSALKNNMDKEIINSIESSPELRKEMRKVFQKANRRIQNIEKSGRFSPAVASLGKGDIDKFSKFHFRGNNWRELKKEYAKAVSFLQQPTSTATGARQFEEQVKSQLDLTANQWDEARETIMNNYDAVTADLLETLPYKKLVQEMYAETTTDVSDQIESDAKSIADNLQKSINKSAKEHADEIDEFLDWFDSSF